MSSDSSCRQRVLSLCEECILHALSCLTTIDRAPVRLSSSTSLSTQLVAHSARNKTFVGIVCVLSAIYNAVTSGRFINKRALYYEHITLFTSQTASDACLDRFTAFLSLPRFRCNVVASARGSVVGALTFVFDGESVSAANSIAIPLAPLLMSGVACGERVHFVLVAEKETAYRRLRNERFAERNGGIVVGGRGYPSVATREFLLAIRAALRLPAFIVTDGDSDGVGVYLTYRYGGANNTALANSDIRLIGIFIDDIDGARPDSTRPLTARDRQHIRRLSETATARNDTTALAALNALTVAGCKCEIECFDDRNLSAHIARKIQAALAQQTDSSHSTL